MSKYPDLGQLVLMLLAEDAAEFYAAIGQRRLAQAEQVRATRYARICNTARSSDAQNNRATIPPVHNQN